MSWADQILGSEDAAAAENAPAVPAADDAGVAETTEQLSALAVTETSAPAPAPAAAVDPATGEFAEVRRWGLGYGLEERDQEILVEMADENSPIYSTVDSFRELGLREDILEGIFTKMKFQRPSKIQERALPLILADPPMHLIAQSQSGTGKTAAFVIGMLSRIDPSVDAPQALCLANTRELARQTFDVCQLMGECTTISMAKLLKLDRKKKAKATNAQLICGTPGTIIKYHSKGLVDLSQVRIFVLDEADKMMDAQGMKDESLRIKAFLPDDVQCLLFSATFSDPVWEFANEAMPNANTMRLARKEVTLDNIKQFVVECDTSEARFNVLCELYGQLTVGQMIIFVHTIKGCDKLAAQLEAAGHTVSVIHSKLSVNRRDAIVDQFREGMTKVLVTTDVLARGVDFETVNLVVNYDMPMGAPPANVAQPETYIHRIGRTARFGRKGVAINFVFDDNSRRVLAEIEQYYGHPVVPLPIEAFSQLEEAMKPAASDSSALVVVGDADAHAQALVSVLD